jgi:hypothetical protein
VSSAIVTASDTITTTESTRGTRLQCIMFYMIYGHYGDAPPPVDIPRGA